MPNICPAEQAKDQMKLICMQAQLGYVLLGVLGEKKLAQFGHPNRSVIHILQMVLDMTKTKVTDSLILSVELHRVLSEKFGSQKV